jgi:hypothetical protein
MNYGVECNIFVSKLGTKSNAFLVPYEPCEVHPRRLLIDALKAVKAVCVTILHINSYVRKNHILIVGRPNVRRSGR